MRGKDPVVKWSFFGLTVAVSLWVAGNGLFHYLPLDHHFQKTASYLIYLGAGLINPPFLYLSWAFARKPDEKLAWWKIVFALVTVCVVAYLVFGSQLIMGLVLNVRTNYKEVALLPSINVVYNIIFVGLISWVIRNLIHAMKENKGAVHAQLMYVLTGTTIIVVPGIVFNMLLPVVGDFRFTWVGTGSTIIWLGFISYAIVTQQLFDIRVIIRRTVIYSGLLLFILGLYSMIVFFFSAAFGGGNAFDTKTFIANLIAALLIALGFDPIRQYLTRITDKFLFKKQYDSQAVLNDLSQKLSESIDIQSAAQTLVTLIRTNMRLRHAAVVTFSNEENKIVVKDVIHDNYADPSLLSLKPENLLLQQMARHPQLLNEQDLQEQCRNLQVMHQDAQACQMLLVDLQKLGVSIAIPILLKDKAIGIFLVGEKMSGDLFDLKDIEFLKIVANQTTNAIQKARFWEEDQLKSEFVSIASHELLTPTAAIKGYLSMILDDNMGQVDDQARVFLTKVYGSADRLAHLVEDLLNVSRIESGRLSVNKRPFSLAEHTQKAVDELQVNAKAKNLDLAFVADQAQLPNVFADPDHIYRVLINLIGNAVKYTPRGWVRCYVTQPNATHLMFTVTDSGLGIPEADQAHLFEKFYRADRREIYGIQGTGLGLYISKKVVELLGGEISLTSVEGKGTTFFVTVPIASGAEALSEPPQPVVKTASSMAPAIMPPAAPSPAPQEPAVSPHPHTGTS